MERAELRHHSELARQQALNAAIRLDYLLRECRQDHRAATCFYDRELSGDRLLKLLLVQERLREATTALRFIT